VVVEPGTVVVVERGTVVVVVERGTVVVVERGTVVVVVIGATPVVWLRTYTPAPAPEVVLESPLPETFELPLAAPPPVAPPLVVPPVVPPVLTTGFVYCALSAARKSLRPPGSPTCFTMVVRPLTLVANLSNL
jgi:hypothetical protein